MTFTDLDEVVDLIKQGLGTEAEVAEALTPNKPRDSYVQTLAMQGRPSQH